MKIALIILMPFVGTTLGALMVYLIKNKINRRIEKLLLGFAAGVMIAASIWSLIIPAIELSSERKIVWGPAAIGFTLGMLFLLLLDSLLPHQHIDSSEPEGIKAKLGKSKLLFLSVLLHNIPEGMAVGAIIAGFLSNKEIISLAGAMTLAIGISLQNFPEGAIVSIPLKTSGLTKNKAFLYGVISGIVEPLSAILMILLAKYLNPLLPYFLSFAAGAMIYVVVEELIPESQADKHSNIATIGVLIGFITMMILDIQLG